MTQMTASEKDMFLQTLDRECQTTLKLLHAYPAEKSDLKPHEKSKNARELAWMFVLEQGLVDMALKGQFAPQPPPAPPSFADIAPAFESATRETLAKVRSASDETLSRTAKFPVGPGQMGDVRVMDLLWMALMDQVHHRGQFSVYLRMAGGKVPSIYGPTADEPWR